MEVKNSLTFEQQVDKLSEKGFIVDDKSFCENFFRSVNYYRFSAYLLPYKKSDGTYIRDVHFMQIYKIYEFDRKLRTILFKTIEQIEIFLRTQISYYFSFQYGTIGYLYPENFGVKHNHEIFLNKIGYIINKNRKAPVFKHHIEKYNGFFPIWVITEYFTMGMLSKFYSDLKIPDKKKLANDLFETKYKYLDSWLKCLTSLRNISAHYSRLYYWTFSDIPKCNKNMDEIIRGFDIPRRSLFAQLLALKVLYTNKEGWNNIIDYSIKPLIDEYREYINLKHIGFPYEWYDILKNPIIAFQF